MKRCWIGFGLLIVLLAFSLLVTWIMEEIHRPIARDLLTAGEYALAGDWDRAEMLFQQAQDTWKEKECLRACFADHNPMEDIDAGFARLELFLRLRNRTQFTSTCGELARKTEAMGDAHGLKWENFF